jgi:hypothetical protein
MPDQPVTAADVLAAEIEWAVASGDAAEIGVYLVDALLAAGYHVVREGEVIRSDGTLARLERVATITGGKLTPDGRSFAAEPLFRLAPVQPLPAETVSGG